MLPNVNGMKFRNFGRKEKNLASEEEAMTTSQEPPISTSGLSDESTSGGEETTRVSSTEPVTENLPSEEAMTTSQEPSMSTSGLSDKSASGGEETTRVSHTEPVTENLPSEEAMTTSQEPSMSTSGLSDKSASGGEGTTRVSHTEPVTAKDVTQWHNWGDSSYKFINTLKLTWEEAAVACKVMMGEGAHLVFIESEREQKEVTRVVNTISQPCQGWWIGLLVNPIEGVWKWYNVTASFTNWGPGQPDNYGDNENCVQIHKNQNDHGYWNDINCSWKRCFICEKDFL